MGQVYSFIDANGETRLLAEIDPPPSFNGGAITADTSITGDDTGPAALEVTSASAAIAVLIQGTDDPNLGDLLQVRNRANGAFVVEIGGEGWVVLSNNDPTVEALYVQPLQTQNAGKRIARFIDPDSSTEVAVSRTGYLEINAHAAPADADVPTGGLQFWFDDTNGASALNIKAKQADGTVKTATIPVIT